MPKSAGHSTPEKKKASLATIRKKGPEKTGLPTSIDAIIRVMDAREPGANYHTRQADSRGGVSTTRGKLRTWARANPALPGAYFALTGSWAPPDDEALEAIIVKIKEIIAAKKK